jgi:hypothetical protein
MGLWDVIDSEEDKIRLVALKSIENWIAPVVKRVVRQGATKAKISLVGNGIFGLNGSINNPDVVAVFKEMCRQLSLEGFRLGLIFACDREHYFLRNWNPKVAGKLANYPLLTWHCQKCTGDHFRSNGVLKAFTIEWSEKTKEKASLEEPIDTEGPKIVAEPHKSEEESGITHVQNITYNIHDSSIVGDLNSIPHKKNDE